MSQTIKPFTVSAGRRHLPELAQANLATFRCSEYFVEIDPKITSDDLLNPALWGPQKFVRRGDKIRVLAADNSYYGEYLVARTEAGFPVLQVIALIQRAAPASEDGQDAKTRIEYRPDAQWVAIHDGRIVARDLPTKEAARAALDLHLEKEAAA